MNVNALEKIDRVDRKRPMGLLREPAGSRYQDGMNLYEFVKDDPVINVDPDGKQVWSPLPGVNPGGYPNSGPPNTAPPAPPTTAPIEKIVPPIQKLINGPLPRMGLKAACGKVASGLIGLGADASTLARGAVGGFFWILFNPTPTGSTAELPPHAYPPPTTQPSGGGGPMPPTKPRFSGPQLPTL